MAYRLEDLDPPTCEALITLGSVIRELRRSRGLSQRGLGRRCGLSQSTISRLESGKAPWLRVVWVARVLAGLDLGPGALGFEEAPMLSKEVGWEILMRRFEVGRRHRDLQALAESRRLARERALEDLRRKPVPKHRKPR